MKLKWTQGLKAKIAAWIMQFLVGWVKDATPQYAMMARRRAKKKILAEVKAAAATKTKADDIIPAGSDIFMGFATMRKAQHKIGEIFVPLGRLAAGLNAGLDENKASTVLLLREIRETANEANRILDEAE